MMRHLSRIFHCFSTAIATSSSWARLYDHFLVAIICREIASLKSDRKVLPSLRIGDLVMKSHEVSGLTDKLYQGIIIIAIFITTNLSVPVNGAQNNSDKITVLYFSIEGKESFESKIRPFFKRQTSNCKNCAIINQTPYNEKGEYQYDLLKEQIENSSEEASILFFDWNEKFSDKKHAGLLDTLKKKIQEGKIIISSTGVALPDQPTVPLGKTFFGQLENAFIIGELEPGNRLRSMSFFGPQMLTAVLPPRDLIGQGFGSLLFVSRLASSYPKRDSSHWVDHLKAKKAKSRALFPDVEEFFR